MTTNLLEVQGLKVVYRGKASETKALDNAWLSIPPDGYTLGVVGESGSGKSTLGLSIMNAIEPPGGIVGGKIDFAGRNVLKMSSSELRSYRWKEVSMVFQAAMNSLNPVKPVINPITEVIRQHTDASRDEAHETALALLSDVGINPNRSNNYPHEFSGGMRQRVVIALALALSPRLLIADEPTSALDVVVQQQILQLLKTMIAKKNLSLIFITHEIALLNNICDNVAVMYAGEIVEVGPTQKVLSKPLHPYTEMLIGTIIRMGSNLQSLGGTVAYDSKSRGLLPESACKYSDRCKYAFGRCKVERPALREVERGRWVACHKYN